MYSSKSSTRSPGGSAGSRRVSMNDCVAGRDLVGVDLVAEHQQHVRPRARAARRACAGPACAARRSRGRAGPGPSSASSGGSCGRGHAAGAERDLERRPPSGRCGTRSAGKPSSQRPDALAVELDRRTRASCRARGHRSRRARSGGRDAERALASAEDLDLARPRRSPPRARPRSRPRSEAGVQVRARACFDRTPGSSFRIVESQLQEVGRSIHAAFPGKSRHPLRRSTSGRWSSPPTTPSCARRCSASSTSTPACRSLDDLARHLTGYLEEVDDRPPPIEAAMRMAGTKAGRAALGRGGRRGRAPHGAPLHRRRDAHGRRCRRSATSGRTARPCRVDLLGEATVTAGRGRPLRRSAAWTRSRRSPAPRGAGRSGPMLEARLARAGSRA